MKKRFFSRLLGTACALCIGAAALGGCGLSAGSAWDIREDGTYYLVDGEAATGWLTVEDNRYYFDTDGRMVTGWQEIDGEHYYFTEDGVMESGWLELEGKRYYLRQQGSLVTGWLSLDGQRYYLNGDGSAATGITQVDGAAYVFDGDGHLASGWAEFGGKKAYANENGHPATGWAEIDGERYYFDESGILYTGWLELDGLTYYLTKDGSAARGECTIGGETYFFASNGQQIYLVNPWHTVPEDYTVELVDIGRSHQVAAEAYEDYLEMITDCEAAGLDPVVCSSYRTQEYQQKLFTRKVESYTKQGYSEEKAKSLAGRSVAVPGTSEHQLGLALDIIDNSNWNLDESQAKTATQQWLMEHSWEYGWILRYPDGSSGRTGIIYEPWHYRYVGREIAREIHDLGVCLEEYLDMLTKGVG